MALKTTQMPSKAQKTEQNTVKPQSKGCVSTVDAHKQEKVTAKATQKVPEPLPKSADAPERLSKCLKEQWEGQKERQIGKKQEKRQ